MNKQTQEALKLAIEWLDKEPQSMKDFEEKENAINACKEALEQPINEFNPDWDATEEIVKENINLHQKIEALEQQEIGDAEIKQMLNDIEYYQNRVEELEQALKGGVK